MWENWEFIPWWWTNWVSRVCSSSTSHMSVPYHGFNISSYPNSEFVVTFAAILCQLAVARQSIPSLVFLKSIKSDAISGHLYSKVFVPLFSYNVSCRIAQKTLSGKRLLCNLEIEITRKQRNMQFFSREDLTSRDTSYLNTVEPSLIKWLFIYALSPIWN